jgi:GAF domain-containing protein
MLQQDEEYARHNVTVAAQYAREIMVFQCIDTQSKYSLEKLDGLGIKSGVALPLINRGNFFGVLTVFSSTPNGFDVAEIKLMDELASYLAYGIATLRTRGMNSLPQKIMMSA